MSPLYITRLWVHLLIMKFFPAVMIELKSFTCFSLKLDQKEMSFADCMGMKDCGF